MSQEQENQNEEIKLETTGETSCKSTGLIVLSIISLIFSIVALGLSAWNTHSLANGGSSDTAAKENNRDRVIISKQYDKGQSLDKAITTKKPIVAFFYTDWCGFCQRFVPTFHKISKDKEIKKNFAIAYINCEDDKNTEHVQAYGIQGFPTVYVIRPDGKKVQLDNNTFFNDDSVEVVKENILKVLDEE